MTPEDFRQNGYALIDWIAQYMEGIEQYPVSNPQIRPGDVRASLPPHPPTEIEPFANVIADLDATALRDLARQAEDVYRQAQDRLRAGDWAGYGEAIDRLGQLIRQIVENAPEEPLSPAPDAPGGPAAESLGRTAPTL